MIVLGWQTSLIRSNDDERRRGSEDLPSLMATEHKPEVLSHRHRLRWADRSQLVLKVDLNKPMGMLQITNSSSEAQKPSMGISKRGYL
jgi:hypothetical protein